MDRPIRKRIGRRAWVTAALVLAGVAALFLAAYMFVGPAESSVRVAASTLTIGPAQASLFHDFLPAQAEVAPLQTVYVDTLEGGRVDRLVAGDGQLVSAGDVLAKLTNPQLVLDVTSREAQIAEQMSVVSAQAVALDQNHLQMQDQLQTAAYNKLRADHELTIKSSLHDEGDESDEALANARREATYANNRLGTLKGGAATQAGAEQAQRLQIRQTNGRLENNLNAVRDTLQALEVRAPVPGRLTGFSLQPGQLVKAGDRIGEVDSEGAYKLTADLDEYYLNRVAVGQSASAVVDGSPYALRVSRVLPQVTNGRFRAEFNFEGRTPASIRRGQTIQLKLQLGGDHPALLVPMGPWFETTGGAWAFVVSADGGHADRRPIAIGRHNTDQVEISSGLRPNDRIITSDYTQYDRVNRLVISK